MNITYVLTALNAGGVGNVTRTLANQMHHMGHNIAMVAFNRGGEESPTPYQTVIFPYTQTNAPVFVLSFLRLCLHFLRNRNIHMVIIASDYPALITIAALKLTCHKAFIIANSHTTVSVYAGTQSRFKRMLLWLAGISYRFANVTANVSVAAAEDSRTFFRLKHVKTLYNPVCTKAMLTAQPTTHPHPWLSNNKLTCLVACGRLTASKNYELMLNAFAIVHRQQPHTRLIILGEGELHESLQAQATQLNIANAVAFVGQVTNPSDYFYFSRALWLTSHYEGMPTVLIEAMAAGIPCVSVNCPSGPAELLENDTYGKLVEGWDINTNATDMLNFLKEKPKDRSFYRKRAAFFGTEKRTQAYLDLLKSKN